MSSDFQQDFSQGNNSSNSHGQQKGDGDKPYAHEQIARLLELRYL